MGVVFAPAVEGPRQGRITVSDAAGRSHTAALRGIGGIPAPVIAPSALSFDPQAVGTSTPDEEVTVRNEGTWPLTVANVVVDGADASDFPLGASCEGAVLRTDETCTMRVRFAPSAVGSRTAQLRFTSNASAAPHVIPLEGTGA